MPKLKDLTGQKFGRLLVLSRAESPNPKYGAYWLCKCDCGSITIVRANCLKNSTYSCGCLKTEKDIQKGQKRKTHGMSQKRIYKIWTDIKTRCYNKNNKEYKWYGERNIKMCNEWKNDFRVFYDWAIQNGYTEELSIDRIEVNGDYEPNNCRWADKLTQANNTRTNHYVEINGVTHTVAEWSRIYNINRNYIYIRVQRGWNWIDAITTPLNKYQKKEAIQC